MIKTISLIFTALSIIACPLSFAGDITREVSGDSGDNFFELSVGVNSQKNDRIQTEEAKKDSSGINLGLGWEYKWKGLFSEAIQSSYSGLNLGYQLWQDDHLRLDIIGMNAYGRASENDEITPDISEEERNRRLVKRDTITLNGGVRATYYWKDNIFQFRLESDYSQKNAGAQGSFLVGRAWQIRNWNIHGLTGLEWNSRKRSEFLWGVSSLEATEQFPEYQASSTLNYSFEIGATYPISENWVSRTRLVAFLLDSAVSESPLANGDDIAGEISTSIAYVF